MYSYMYTGTKTQTSFKAYYIYEVELRTDDLQ